MVETKSRLIYKNIIYSGLLTSVGAILFYLSTGGTPLLSFIQLLIVSCLVGLIIGLFNSAFLFLFSLTQYGKLILVDRRIGLIEVGLFFIALIAVKLLIDLVPLEYQFTKSSNIKTKSIFFDEFKILYSFLIVLGILVLLKRSFLKMANSSTSKNS